MELCDTPWKQFRGLMFSRKKNLLFQFSDEKVRHIHNCFVFFPIDLVFLDAKEEIVELKFNLKPFEFYTSKHPAKYLIEYSI